MRDNCGECAICADMPRFGGQGSMLQACVGRQCLKMESLVVPGGGGYRCSRCGQLKKGHVCSNPLARAKLVAAAAGEAAGEVAMSPVAAPPLPPKVSNTVHLPRTAAEALAAAEAGRALATAVALRAGEASKAAPGTRNEVAQQQCAQKSLSRTLNGACSPSAKTAQVAGSRQGDGAFAEEVDVEVLEVSSSVSKK